MFAVNAEEVGFDGRLVKCGNCGKEWFQESKAQILEKKLICWQAENVNCIYKINFVYNTDSKTLTANTEHAYFREMEVKMVELADFFWVFFCNNNTHLQ